jgi:hypothetical protein
LNKTESCINLSYQTLNKTESCINLSYQLWIKLNPV